MVDVGDDREVADVLGGPGHVPPSMETGAACARALFGPLSPPLFAGLPSLARVPGGPALIGKTLLPRALWRSPIAFGALVKHSKDVPEAVRRSWVDPLARSKAIRRDYRAVI